MKITILFSAFILVTLSACTQENPQMKNFLKEKYGDIQNLKWEKDSNGFTEAQFTSNGKQLRVDFNDDGSWRETEMSVKFDEMPEAVQKAALKKFKKSEIKEIEKVESAEKGEFFDVEVKQEGEKKLDYLFKPNGELLETER